jgi:16S rRNA processing protein RimM
MTDPQRILRHKFIFLQLEGLPVPFFIEEMDVNGEQLTVKLEGIDTQEAARNFTKKDVFLEKLIERKRKVPLTWKELKGYTITDEEFGTIGLIEEVVEYPMQFIARVIKDEKEILIPLNEELVDEVDSKSKIVRVTLPEGLLDLYLY